MVQVTPTTTKKKVSLTSWKASSFFTVTSAKQLQESLIQRLFCSVSLFLASVDFTLLSTSDCKESDSIFRARNSSIKSPSLRDMMQLSGRDISHIWTTPILGHHKASTFEKGGKWNLKRHTDSYRTDPCVSAFCCFQVQFVKSSAFLDTRCFSLSYRGKTAVRRIKVGNYHWKIIAKKSWY